MAAARRPAPLPLLLIGLALICAALVLIPWVVQAQSQEVTPTADATGANPPAKPTSLQASAAHDSVTLTWSASTDQTVTHYSILRRNPDVDASQVFHVIESNAGPGTSYTDGTVSASTTYIYRAKAVSPTGVSQWSGYVKAETPAAPDPTPTPTLTPTPEPELESTAVDLAPTNLTAAFAEGGGVALSWTAPGEDADCVTGYEITRAVGEGEMATLVADTASTTTSYTDATTTEAGETYAYQVKAIRGADRSQASEQAEVQVPHDPVDLAPTGLTALTALTLFVSLEGNISYSVHLSWTAPAEDVGSITGYRILRNLGAESLSRYAKQIAATNASTRVFVDGRDADVCFGGAGSGPNVSYFVSAITAGGDSFPARVNVDQTRSFPATQVPDAPTLRGSLYDFSVARSPNGYKVRLRWNDLHHNITGYEISFRGSGTAAWRTIVANAGNVLEYDLESVPPSSAPRTAENMYLYNAFRDQGDFIGFTDGREFRIRALNAAGSSGWSNVVRPFQ